MVIRRRVDVATLAFGVIFVVGLLLLAGGLFGGWKLTGLRWWFVLAFTCCYVLGNAVLAWLVLLPIIRIEGRTAYITTWLGRRETLKLDSFQYASRGNDIEAVLLVHSGVPFGTWVTNTRWHVRLDELVSVLRNSGLPEKSIPPRSIYI